MGWFTDLIAEEASGEAMGMPPGMTTFARLLVNDEYFEDSVYIYYDGKRRDLLKMSKDEFMEIALEAHNNARDTFKKEEPNKFEKMCNDSPTDEGERFFVTSAIFKEMVVRKVGTTSLSGVEEAEVVAELLSLMIHGDHQERWTQMEPVVDSADPHDVA